MVDYLEQLSLYTNWDYEYVTVEGDLDTQIVTLMEMMRDGEIDMMGTMNRTRNWSRCSSIPATAMVPPTRR